MAFIFKSLEESDLPLIFQWLSLPHVAQWWRESKDWDIFAKKYRSWISSDDVMQFVVYDDDNPIGYMQWNDVATDPLRKEQYPSKIYGIDMFIADIGYVGKGYGVQLLKQFIKEQLLPLKPQKIITDPEITNERAIRCYEKAGFKKTKTDKATDGTKLVAAQLMELDLDDV